MSITRPEQTVLNAWLAIAGTAPGHSTFSSHVAIASGPNGETAWVREVNAFVDRNFAGTGGTERLVDAVIANLGLREFPAVRDTILEFFQSRPNDRGGLAADVAQWMNTFTPDAGNTQLINAQAAFRVAIAAAHAHSSNVSNVLDAPIASIVPISPGSPGSPGEAEDAITRTEQVVLNAWMAITGTTPDHLTFNSHASIARAPNGEAAWVNEVNHFVNAHFGGPHGTERLADAVIANLGLGAAPGIRNITIDFFNSQPDNRGGLAIAAADWLRTVTPGAGETALIDAQRVFREANDAAFNYSNDPRSLVAGIFNLDSPIAPPVQPPVDPGAPVTLTTGADRITGTASNFIGGGAGVDQAFGGAGRDLFDSRGGADVFWGGGGNDLFRLENIQNTRSAEFSGAATRYSGMIDHFADFNGAGALEGDQFAIDMPAGAFGSQNLAFSGATVVNVTAVTVASASSFTALAAAITGAQASTAAVAQVFDVTVSSGSLAGRVMVINDDVAGIQTSDAFVNITGIAGNLHASDFVFM